MRDALRNLPTNNVTRKDIARFAGVTPALVTYYFPERNALIEAATVPIIEDLARLIDERLTRSVEPHSRLLQVVTDILACYFKDIAIIELYIAHRRSLNDETAPDGVQDASRSITAFFDEWLSCFPKCHYDGRFLTNALLGICRSIALHHGGEKASDAGGCDSPSLHAIYAEMICRILVDGLSGSTIRGINPLDLSPGPHEDRTRLKAPASMVSSIKPPAPPVPV